MATLLHCEILLAVSLFLFVWCFCTRIQLPWNWPLVGMIPSLFLKIHQIHDACAHVLEETGGTRLAKGLWFTKMDILGTVDPANIHYVMSSNFSNYPKGPEFMTIFEVLGDGIFNSDSELWKIQRNIAQTLINHRQFQKFLVTTTRDKLENGLIPVLDNVSRQGIVIDLQDIFQRLTFDTTCILVTGYDPGCLSIDLPNVPFAKAMDDAEEAILIRHLLPHSIWKLQRLLRFGPANKLHKAWKTLDHIIDGYISMKREELISKGTKLKNEEEGVDLLTSYMNEDEKSTGLTHNNKFFRDTILNLMLAGRDTTSSALTWFLWLVSTHPLVESQIREELKGAIPPEEDSEKWRLFNVEELNNLVYLHGAICEALRLYPPVPFQHKEPHRHDILPTGHHVHPNMKIVIPVYALGRMTFVWGKDSLEFKPERWITERGTIKHEPSYKFFAFNAGPRTCLGKQVAFNQIKAVAAAIIHNYKVQVVEGHCATPNVSIILYMKHGLKVRIAKRWI